MVSFKYSTILFTAFLAAGALAAPTSDAAERERDLTMRTGPENVSCFNSGTKSDRGPFVSAIDTFCAKYNGQTFDNGRAVLEVYPSSQYPVGLFIGAAAVNGCSFVVDGNCNRLLRRPVDECNTGGENGKQGGTVTDECGLWRSDPGNWLDNDST